MKDFWPRIGTYNEMVKDFGFRVKDSKREWKTFGVTLEHPTMEE